MENAVAEMRFRCISLVYRLDHTPDAAIDKAEKLFEWVMQSQGQPETTPRRGRPPKQGSET